MKLPLDTRLILSVSAHSERLSVPAHTMLAESQNKLPFGSAGVWEIAIKRVLGRDDVETDPRSLRRALLDNPHQKSPVTG